MTRSLKKSWATARFTMATKISLIRYENQGPEIQVPDFFEKIKKTSKKMLTGETKGVILKTVKGKQQNIGGNKNDVQAGYYRQLSGRGL